MLTYLYKVHMVETPQCHTIVTRCESKTTSRIHRSLFHHRLKSTLSKNIGSPINNRCDAEQSVLENRVTRDTKSHAFYIIYLSLEPYSRPFNGLNDSRRRVNRNVWLILPPIIARVSRGWIGCRTIDTISNVVAAIPP